MKKLWLLAVLITPLQLIHAQEVKHAPTVAQCQADQRLWLDQLEQPNGEANISTHELTSWISEMVDCRSVDPPNEHQYYNTAGEAVATKATRLENFLVRHNLIGQFYSEDAQGKR